MTASALFKRNPKLTRRSFTLLGASTLASLSVAHLTGCSGTSSSTGSSTSASSSSAASDPCETTLFAFDTVITLSAYCEQSVLDQAQERCTYFENIFSRTIDGSDISKINSAKGQPVEVAEETADIISKSLEYSKETDGLFDISIGAASTLWDFNEGIKPSDKKLKEAIKHIDYRNIAVDGTTITLADPDAKLDLGGIAKGYIADDLAKLFKEAGCESACLNLGGNVYVLGTKPDGSNWKVGVYDPNSDGDDTVIASCEAADKSIVTSGLYERNFTKDGVMYYHILDPKTGYPAETDLLASSIYSEKSVDGDAYATTLFLLGHDKALEFLEEHPEIQGLVVNSEDKVSTTDNSPFEVL